MTCALVYFEPTLLSDSLDAEGDYLEATKPLQAAWYHMQATKVRRTGRDHLLPSSGNTGFVCGSGIATCRCGYVADYLCDGPAGNGKTCDLPICERCRLHVGDELDLCSLHQALLVVDRGAPKP